MSDNTSAVVIPTRLGGPLLADALAAVEGWTVFVVDDSDDGLDLPEGVHGVRAGGLGFAASCNLGLAAAEAAGHPLVVLLNDDARPAAGCINGLLGTWRDGVGAVGPVLIDGDGEVTSAGIRFSWWGRVKESRHVYAEDAPMDAISGACMLVRSSERFAAGYPHGMEDVALCASLRERGLVVVLTPRGRCVHLGGRTLSPADPEAAYGALAGHLRLVDNDWRAAVVLGLAVASVLRTGPSPARLRALGRAWEQR